MSSVAFAANWAESLNAVAATVGVVATLAVGWLGWRAAVPHRRMVFSIEFTPLLSSTHSGLTVSLGPDRFAHPQTATLKINNIGNREFHPADYNGESIEFQLGVRVVSVLTSGSTGNRRVPPASVYGNSLQIEPYVIHKRQEITYKLLLDGPDPALSLRHSLSGSLKEATGGGKKTVRWVYVGLAICSILAGTLYGAKVAVPQRDEWYRQGYEQGIVDGEGATRECGRASGCGSSSPSAVPSASPSPS